MEYVNFNCGDCVTANPADADECNAFAYIDVTRHTKDYKESTGVCRVWLVPDVTGQSAAFIVSWIYDECKTNEEAIRQVEYGKELLETHFNRQIVTALQSAVYERYKLKWMLEHGHTISELITRISYEMVEANMEVRDAYNKMQAEKGFGEGPEDCWLPYPLFISMKWGDEARIKEFLRGNEFEIWKRRELFT